MLKKIFLKFLITVQIISLYICKNILEIKSLKDFIKTAENFEEVDNLLIEGKMVKIWINVKKIKIKNNKKYYKEIKRY